MLGRQIGGLGATQHLRRPAALADDRLGYLKEDFSVSRSAENLRLPPFVSIMPHFDSHNATGFAASPFQKRWFSKGSNRGNRWPTSHRKPTGFRRIAAFHSPARFYRSLLHSHWHRERQHRLAISIRLPGTQIPLLRKVSTPHRSMTGSGSARLPIRFPRTSRGVPLFDLCPQNWRSNFNKQKVVSPRNCSFKTCG